MMSYLLNNQQKFNDVVFEHRNKNYGAYAIRSAYGNTVLKSLLMVCLTSCAVAALAYLLTRKLTEAPDISGQTIPEISTPVYLPPDEITQPRAPEPPAQRPPLKTNPLLPDNTANMRIVDSTAAETPSQSIQENLPAMAVGNTGTAGPVTATDPGEGGQGTAPAGTGTKPAGGDVVFFADSEPEFEGGLKALHQFVSSHLRYPQRAIDDGREGTVHVKFIVDEKGKVANITLQNNLGSGLDEEALRVVSMIPKFKTPAKVNGQPVKMYYQMPIRFKYR
jgi:protein TonB